MRSSSGGGMGLEEYLRFYEKPAGDFSAADLRKVINMHGFRLDGTQRQLKLALKRIRLMPPTRCTVQSTGTSRNRIRSAALTVNHIQADLAALSWSDAPVASFQTISQSSAAPAPEAALRRQLVPDRHSHQQDEYPMTRCGPSYLDPGRPPRLSSDQRRRRGRPPKKIVQATVRPSMQLQEFPLHSRAGGRPPKTRPCQLVSVTAEETLHQKNADPQRRPRGRPPKKKPHPEPPSDQPLPVLSEAGLPPKQKEQYGPPVLPSPPSQERDGTPPVPSCERPPPSTPTLLLCLPTQHTEPATATATLPTPTPPPPMPAPLPHTLSPPGFSFPAYVRSRTPQCSLTPPWQSYQRLPCPPPHPPPPRWLVRSPLGRHIESGGETQVGWAGRILSVRAASVSHDIIEIDDDD